MRIVAIGKCTIGLRPLGQYIFVVACGASTHIKDVCLAHLSQSMVFLNGYTQIGNDYSQQLNTIADGNIIEPFIAFLPQQ